ncbi:MAG: hypothetical protein FJ271_20030 [Planctomycetes bacterium]|nr:hypothetical protein [Planctomycetota bacterium]
MTKPDVMWLTARQALVFHRGRIWSLFQEGETAAWVVQVGAGLRGDSLTDLGKFVARFPGGYHAALDWLHKGDLESPTAPTGNQENKTEKRRMKN